MKKFVALLVSSLLVCLVIGTALAETGFDKTIYSITTFIEWTSPDQSSGARWHIEWDTNVSNISANPNRRAYMRVFDEYGNYASEPYLYSTYSTAFHDYKTGFGYGDANTMVKGRLDNRDGAQAPLNVKGVFFN